jgi:hypothetical protein
MALGSSPYAAERTPQKAGEGGWTPEVNEATNRAYEGMGGEIKRCYDFLRQVLFCVSFRVWVRRQLDRRKRYRFPGNS